MNKLTIVFLSALILSGCWDDKQDGQKIVCDSACRAERSGKADFPALDTSTPDSLKKAPVKGQ